MADSSPDPMQDSPSRSASIPDSFKHLFPPADDDSPGARFRREVAELAVLVWRRSNDPSAARSVAPDVELGATNAFLILRIADVLRQRFLGDGAFADKRVLLLHELERHRGVVLWRLRERLGLRASTLSMLIRRCVAAGHVAKRRSLEDGRSWRLELTDEGHRQAERAEATFRAAEDTLLDWLTPAEREELRRLLRKALKALADQQPAL